MYRIKDTALESYRVIPQIFVKALQFRAMNDVSTMFT